MTMKCTNCGAEMKDDSKFCSSCGAAMTAVLSGTDQSRNEMKERPGLNPERVTLCPDGKYRWVYEYPMMRNPVLFFTIIKILCLCALAPALVVFLSDIGRSGLADAFLSAAKVFFITAAIMVVLSFLAFLIVAASYGWKYVVVFVMDEDGIDHIQQQKQMKKAQVIGILTALAGGAAGNPGRTGQGLLIASHGSLSSRFSAVRRIKGYPRSQVIKVNSLFSKNQVYVPCEDYDFVWDYITSRCPGAKIS